MFSFEYSIELNPHGRPVITPTEKTDKELDFIEHKFMALELARTIITNTIDNHDENPEKYSLQPSDLAGLLAAKSDIEKICDIFANAIKNQMNLMDDANAILNPQTYNLQVKTMKDLYSLNYNGIIYDTTIFKRVEGLRVKVLADMRIYELRGGIDNNNWIDVTNE
jgi:hypothetical protein